MSSEANGCAAGCLFSVLGVIGALATLAGQSLYWLMWGEWPGLSLIWLLAKGAGYLRDKTVLEWVINPQSWIGLHKILANLPLSGALFLLGILIGILTGALMLLIREEEEI